MAFHIPCNQRRSSNNRQSPVYIGFDRAKRKFNWWGFHGLWMSLFSLLTLGFTSPVPLLVSLNGLRKKKGPRNAAVAGAVFSLIGVAMAGMIVEATMEAHQAKNQRQIARTVAKQKNVTKQMIAVAVKELKTYRDSHDGQLPSIIDCNMLVIKHVDPWGESLRFDGHGDHGIVRSAGPDLKFESGDDVEVKIEGDTDRNEQLLPM